MTTRWFQYVCVTAQMTWNDVRISNMKYIYSYKIILSLRRGLRHFKIDSVHVVVQILFLWLKMRDEEIPLRNMNRVISIFIFVSDVKYSYYIWSSLMITL